MELAIDKDIDINIEFNRKDMDTPGVLRLSHCCHLGAAFLSETPIDEYSEMDFQIKLNASGQNGSEIHCKGVVVASAFEDEQEMYKIYLLYTNIDIQSQKKLKIFAEGNKLTCPHCRSF
jgi:hypothetical protein